MALDLAKHGKKLIDAIVSEFQTIPAFETWISLQIPENVANIVRPNGRFDERVYDILQWLVSRNAETDVLQAMADDPPNGSVVLPNVIYAVTLGEVEADANKRNGVKPIDPHDDFFVTQRPFANRKKLRDVLKVFDQAQPGADSVLVIDGDRFTGKSYSIRFAVQCAPKERFVAVDIGRWGTKKQLNVRDLVQLIDGYKNQDLPSYDDTKEDSAVGPMLMWLTAKLKGTKTWVIIDHCNRPILTRPALDLLTELAGSIENGFLPGVKLILADMDRAKLPGALPYRSHYDRAVLPDEAAVSQWVQSLATHLEKTVSEQQVTNFVAQAFDGIKIAIGQPTNGQPAGQPANGQPVNGQPPNGQAVNDQPADEQPTIDQAAVMLEQRLYKIFDDIRAL
jgi:hypothetical protein